MQADVSDAQERYFRLLRRHLECVYGFHAARSLYALFVCRMDDLQSMSDKHARILLRVRPAEIEPLMKEILDL